MESACKGLSRAETARGIEQSPFGIESLSEGELHTQIAEGLRLEGLGALREQPYPGEWVYKKGRRRVLPDESQRLRCDLVVTSRAGLRLADRLREAKRHENVRASMGGSLFEEQALAEAPLHDADAAGVDEAFWMEIKTCGQFTYIDGVPGPWAYGGPLVRGVSDDLRKLRNDTEVVHGGVLAVLFCADESVARHDLEVVAQRCLDRGLLGTLPTIGGIVVPDRIGNRWCGVAMFTPSRGALVE